MSGDTWQTPDLILDRVRSIGGIELDPCTVPNNPTGARRFVTEDDRPDGLAADWTALAGDALCFCNPPYSRGLVGEWAEKILHEHRRGCEILALMRGDTSTRWAHALISAATRICWPPRIKFRGAAGAPNFSNAIFYFGPRPVAFTRAFHDLGPLVAPIPEFNSPSRSAATRERATNKRRGVRKI